MENIIIKNRIKMIDNPSLTNQIIDLHFAKNKYQPEINRLQNQVRFLKKIIFYIAGKK